MVVLLLSLMPFVLAHGGEDHGQAAISAPSSGSLVVASGQQVELALARSGAELVVWVADRESSAPLESGSLSLSLSSAGKEPWSAQAAAPESPGRFRLGTAPAEGSWSGPLILGGERADLLAISDLDLSPSVAAAETAGSPAWSAAPALLLGLLGLGAGLWLGRRRPALAALPLFGLVLLPEAVRAHGGEDHGAPAALAAAVGSGLSLPLESQFLLGLRTARLGLAPLQDAVVGLGVVVPLPGAGVTQRAPVSGLFLPGGDWAPGRLITAGEPLATIQESSSAPDRAALLGELAAARAELVEAEAAAALARRDAARIDTLGESLSERQRLERQLDQQRSAQRLEEARRRLSGLSGGGAFGLRAPLTGRLSRLLVAPGEQVEPGDPLYTVVGEGRQVQVLLPVEEAAGVQAGAPVRLQALGRPWSGAVLDPGHEVLGNGQVTLTLLLHGGAELLPGTPVTAWIGRGTSSVGVAMPLSALVRSGGESFAFVKTGPERFELRRLALGPGDGERVQVLSGLSAGERVVVAALTSLRAVAGR
jgi:multidrug efflux pump subunit AcrA (membrane-fusion protein)